MLKIERARFHKVLQGQTLQKIAAAYCVSEWAIAKENHLKQEVWAGQILKIPSCYGNRYVAQAGDERSLLCGSEENYKKKNGPHLYPGRRVVL